MQDLDHRLSELLRAAQDGDRLADQTLLAEAAARSAAPRRTTAVSSPAAAFPWPLSR